MEDKDLKKVDLGVTDEASAQVLKEQILDDKNRLEEVLAGLTEEEALVEIAD